MVLTQTRPLPQELKLLHLTQVSLEKFRIQLNNRVAALEQGVDTVAIPVPAVYQRLLAMSETMEAEVDSAIALAVQDNPVWNA